MKKRILILIFIIGGFSLKSASLYFPPITGTAWESVTPASLGWCEDKIPALYDFLETKNTKAFIVLKDGKIVMEKYFGTFVQDSLWYWASAGKTLTAFTVGIAQQEGYLSINDTTSNYLGLGWTSCPADKEEKITIKHQLSMTSGLDDGVADVYCTDAACLQYKADAGTRWAYHNGPYTLLDAVVENATGRSLNTYFAQKVRNVIGMNGAFIPVDYNNVYYSTARSMARFGLLLLNNGNWNGTAVMTDTDYFNQMVNTSQSINQSYGYLCWLNGKSSFHIPQSQIQFSGYLEPNAPAYMYAALGKNGQIINVVPSQGLVLIRMGNVPEEGDITILFNDDVWVKLNDIICSNTSVNQTKSTETDCKLYPNPATDNISIELSQQAFDLQIFDTTDKLITAKTSCFDKETLDVTGLTGGLYIVRVKTQEEKVWSKSFVVGR